MDVSQSRDALYFPHIHIRDVDWLKATLLCFPQVRRMVPDRYHLRDSTEIHEFRKLQNHRGEPLLVEEDLRSPIVDEAQYQLLQTLQVHSDVLVPRFSMETTMRDYGDQFEAFQIYGSKVMWELKDYLSRQRLTWSGSHVHHSGSWLAVHPRLGETIMSIIAIAIAKSKGLDIVTSSGNLHHALVTLDTQLMINQLLEEYPIPSSIDPRESIVDKVDDVAMLVLTSAFDVSKLTPAQIAELIKDGKSLNAFKDALIPIVARIPDITDPDERTKRLKGAAEQVIAEWQSYKRSLPRFALDAMIEGIKEVKVPEIAAGLVGASSGFTLAGEAGLALGLVTYGALSIWRKYKKDANSPYSYLTKVEKAGATLAFPPMLV